MYNTKEHVSLGGKTILVTGSPGFIGANLVMRLLSDPSFEAPLMIVSLENMNDYYDTALKEYRLSQINAIKADDRTKHVFIKGNIAEKALVEKSLRSTVLT